MPNTGKPSPNCELCRTRRVKCDLTRPACTRCIKYGAICPGYRDDLDLLFHNQSVDTVGKQVAKRRGFDIQQPGSNGGIFPASSGSAFNTADPMSFAGFTPAHPNIGPSFTSLEIALGSPITRHSVSVVLKLFSLSTGVLSTIGYLKFLPDLYSEADETSSLFVATNTLARAYVANQTNSVVDRSEISELYGNGLKSIYEELQKDPNNAKDETVLAVWVLAVYEIITGSQQTTTRPGPDAWHAHIEGLAGLLSLRGPEQFSSRRGRDIFWTIFAHILIRSMTINVPCPVESHQWIALFVASVDPQPDSLENQIILVSTYIVDASSLLPRLIAKINSGPVSFIDYRALEAELDVAESIIREDIYVAHSAMSSHIYLWDLYRAARIKVNHVFLLLINSAMFCAAEGLYGESGTTEGVFQALTHRRQQCLKTIHTMAQDILNTIHPTIMLYSSTPMPTPSPHLSTNSAVMQDSLPPICAADALRLLWPLSIVQALPSVRSDQRRIAREVNYAIGTHWGIREALKERPKPLFVPPEAAWKEEEMEVEHTPGVY